MIILRLKTSLHIRYMKVNKRYMPAGFVSDEIAPSSLSIYLQTDMYLHTHSVMSVLPTSSVVLSLSQGRQENCPVNG